MTMVLRVAKLASALLTVCFLHGSLAKPRIVPPKLRTGAHLSPLRPHSYTGEQFQTTSTREFTDLMKHSTPFSQGIMQRQMGTTGDWLPYGIPADVLGNMTFRSDGYPNALPHFFLSWGPECQVTVMATIGAGAAFVEDGEYVANWQGNGTLSFEGDAKLLNMTSATSARIVVQPKSGVVVRLMTTDTSNPLYGITLVPVSQMNADGTAPRFHSQFLQKLEGAAVLRFSGWQIIDEWNITARDWAKRTLPSMQTQAGPLGVAVEHMVELANAIGADAWFSMPMNPDATEGATHVYAANFAALVKASLRPDLRVYVEYGSCCLNGLAPGWATQENAVQSLLAWRAWEAAFSDDTSRVVNLISSLAQIDKFGTNIGAVEAAAIDAGFGSLCIYGEDPCEPYDGFNASASYGQLTSEGLLAEVLWPAMLKQERAVNDRLQQALYRELEVMAFNAIPQIQARGYGHRGTLNWALQCEGCLMRSVVHKYGLTEREELAEGGYIFEEGFYAYYGYEGLSAQQRINGTYWIVDTPAAAKTFCTGIASCGGFTYIRSGEWSCGVGNAYRYGTCPKPGAAYFFLASATGPWVSKKPPTSCTAFTAPPTSSTEDCRPPTVDTYFKIHSAAERPALQAKEEAALAACNVCQKSYQQQWYSYNMPDAGFTLDRLHAALPFLIDRAAEEQRLENNMVEALRSDGMQNLILHYLERLRQMGFAVVVGGKMHREVKLCREGGKECGIRSMMMHPDDNGPTIRAFVAYSSGVRGDAIDRSGPMKTTCAQPCVYGVCEGGSCRCWARASGADCSVLDNAPRCDRPLGLSISGIAYYTREWIFVDVFKYASSWISKDFTSYTWNTGTTVDLRVDGYPASLQVGQAAETLTLWSLERHGVDGWYTVLYDGEGVLSFSSSVTCVRDVAPGRIRVYIKLQTLGQNGLNIRVAHTRPDNPIRNIRVVTPGFEDTFHTSPFHPAYLASLQRFSVLRFMDWMHVNVEGTPASWDRRPTPDYYTQAEKGVAVEYMVRLSNELAASPWFSIPINATDEYIGNFSGYVAQHLRPDLDVYMELANEVWHFGFIGGQYAQQQAAKEGITFLCWYMKRTAQMAVIARQVLGPRRKVVIIAGSQQVNYDVTVQLLACPGIEQASAIALGPYFNGYNTLPDPLVATLNQTLNNYRAQVNESLRLVGLHKAAIVASGKNLPLMSYESGPAGEGDGSANDMAIQANRHPDMRYILRDYLERMDAEMELQVYFTSCGPPSKYGSWGLIEATDQPRNLAVKQLAVDDFLNNGSTCPLVQKCATLNNCGGNGVCGTDGNCYCYRGYSGATCLNASFTDYIACGYRCYFDDGTCQVSEIFGTLRSWACSCHENYTGATCTRFQCQDGCNQRGHCIESGVCSCFRGYHGDSCQHDCGCNHHGQCGGDGKCICDRGWRNNANGTGCEWDCDTANTLGCTGPGQSACGSGSCLQGTCFDGVCRCWAGYTGPSCSVANASLRANYNSAFGINVARTPSLFVDVVKTSVEWVSTWDPDTFAGQFSYQGGNVFWNDRQWEWGNGLEILQTDDGYITNLTKDQSVISLTLRDQCLHAPKGRFVFTYDGDGEIDFGMDAKAAAFQKGRIDVDFTPTCNPFCWFDKKTYDPYCTDNGIPITIRRTNPNNPLRNIRMIMPGFFATHEVEPFHPWVLKNLERFALVRLMDWAATNRDSWVKREPLHATFVRFTVLKTRGGGSARMAELLLRNAADATLLCTSDTAPELCDQDPNTDWAPAVGAATAIVKLPNGSALSSYNWVTSGWDIRVDPLCWRLEISFDNNTWTQVELRDTPQVVTLYRRKRAAVGSPEEGSWYAIRNKTDLLEWDERVLPTHRRQEPVALEYQALLVNTLGADPWVCVHHLASDDYVRKEAQFWLDHLRPDVKVYIEHSNEVWNPLFAQGRFATARGIELGLTNSTCQTTTAHCARVRYNAWRSKQIFAIWAEVWGTTRRSRLKFVLATQTSWSAVTKDMVSASGVGTAGADLLGITAYFSPAGSIDGTWSALTQAEVITRFTGGIPAVIAQLSGAKALAATYGLGVAVYEGGVGLVEDGAIESGQATGYVTELLIATGRSPAFKAAVKQWLDATRQELGDSVPFGYFQDMGFWSKYGQWGMREYYDAATSNSPAAAAVHEHLDARAGARPACVVTGSRGRGLPADSFLGAPAVSSPFEGAQLVAGKRYKLEWDSERLIPGKLDFYLWQGTSCSGNPVPLGAADSTAGNASWQVPDAASGADFFVELRPRVSTMGKSNYSSMFNVVPASQAPLEYMLYVENDVDLLSAFHRDCKKDKDWAIRPEFKIETCVYSSAEGCRTYRTKRKDPRVDGPPPWRHGSFKPLTDCTLHVVGLRQTMKLEGLTRGFDLSATDNLARIVANASLLPPGAIGINVLGAPPGARRLSTSTVELEINVMSDDTLLESAALGLATLSDNTAFSQAAASSLGETSLTVVAGDLSAAEQFVVATNSTGNSTNSTNSTNSSGNGGRCASVPSDLVERARKKGWKAVSCSA